MRVKICGITKPAQGREIAELGATSLGFICAPASPRYVTPAQIAAVVAALPTNFETGTPSCDRVGVFVNADLDVICHTVEIGRLSGVQLHGQESPEFCDRLRHALPTLELIKALRIQSPAALDQVHRYQGYVDTFLLDAYHPTLAGGTGQTLDWTALHTFHPDHPWLLAGGLTPDNVLEALRHLHPDGIDLSSGVEQSPGDKDLAQVARLFDVLHTP